MLGHLRNVVLMFRTQRSSRHKNCRIGGLMFHNQYTNLTPNSPLHGIQQTKYYICSSTYSWRISLLIKYYIALLAKLSNRCSMVWTRPMEEQEVQFFLLQSRVAIKNFCLQLHKNLAEDRQTVQTQKCAVVKVPFCYSFFFVQTTLSMLFQKCFKYSPSFYHETDLYHNGSHQISINDSTLPHPYAIQ